MSGNKTNQLERNDTCFEGGNVLCGMAGQVSIQWRAPRVWMREEVADVFLVSSVMTGKSHMAANGFIVLAATVDPTLITTAVLAARIPDQMEKLLPWVRHRTATHIFAGWVMGAVGAFFAWRHGGGFVSPVVSEVIFGLFLGGALHVLMDMFSMSGVPIVPRYVYGFRFYKTGGGSEYLFLSGVLVVCIFVLFLKEPWIGREIVDLIAGLARNQ